MLTKKKGPNPRKEPPGMEKGLDARIEAILREDAPKRRVQFLVANAKAVAQIANNVPPEGATVVDAHFRPLDHDAMSHVYVNCGPHWVALLAARLGQGRAESVLDRIDKEHGSALATKLTEPLCVPRFHAAELRASLLRELLPSADDRVHGALRLALAVCADQEHAPAILASVSAWHRTRVALVRAGMGLEKARAAPRRDATWSEVVDRIKRDVAEASPLASITGAAVGTQVLVLCAVACYGGPKGLRCVLAGLAAAMHSRVPDAVARAIGTATTTLAQWLPAEVRAMLAPTAGVRCAASSMVGLLAAAGLVPTLAAAAAQAAADCPPATMQELPYDAPCRLIAMACDFAAAALRLESLHTDPPKMPAGSASEWLAWHREKGPAVGGGAEAITSYLDATEKRFNAQRALSRVLGHFDERVPSAMHGILARLTVCAIAAACGLWGPSTSLASGTMLTYLAWHNAALGSAVHLCLRE